jgi:serine-type D-Ala-D-Ala carboxypeptidase
MKRFRTTVLTTLILLAGCVAPEDDRTDPIELQLEALDIRERLAQLIVTEAGDSPWLAGGTVSAGGALFDGRTRISAADGVGRIGAGPPLLRVAEVGDAGAASLALETALATGTPEDLSELGRRAGRTVRNQGAQIGVVRLRVGESVRQGAGSGGPVEIPDRLETFLAAAGEENLLLALEVLAPPGAVEEGGAAVRTWDLARISTVEGAALRAAARAGVAAIVPAAVRIPALTGDSLPIALSSGFHRMVRQDVPWDGVVMVDLPALARLTVASGDSASAGNASGASEREIALAAITAGADLLLSPAEPDVVLEHLESAVLDGRLGMDRVNEAVRRVLRLKSLAGDPAYRPDSNGLRRASASPPRTASPDVAERDPADAGLDPAILARADSAIGEALDDSLFTAAALAVSRRGVTVRMRGYGERGDGASVEPVTTIFDLASLTKVVATTTAIALLVEDRVITLDDAVGAYLPGFTGEGKAGVTVRHLLTHTSGVPSGLWLYGGTRSAADAFDRVQRQSLRREPGEAVEYSDLGMILLARVAEAAAGEPIDRFLARRVFARLGMESTMFVPPLALRDRVVPTALRNERGFMLQGVVHDANAFRLGGLAGHAGLFSTAPDVLRFGQMMLAGGRAGDVRILEPGTVTGFVRRQPGADTRALGWDTPADRSSSGRFFSARSFGHTGYTGTSLWIDPDLEIVVVLLTNRTYDGGQASGIFELRRAVHDAVAGAVTDRSVSRRSGSR